MASGTIGSLSRGGLDSLRSTATDTPIAGGSGGHGGGRTATSNAPGSGGIVGSTDHLATASGGEASVNGNAGAASTSAPTLPPTPYTLLMHDDAYGNIKIGAIAVDQTHVYFAENGGRLLRRRIDGSDKATLFGEWLGHLLGIELAVDQDYVYWIDNGELVRAPKAGGNEDRFELGWSEGDVIADDRYAYAATRGCGFVTRVQHGTLNKEVLTAPVEISLVPGWTHLLLDGSDLYCAGGSRIFVSRSWGPLELLTSEAGTSIGGIGVIDKVLYWLADDAPLKLMRLGEGGKGTQVGTVNYSLISRKVIADPPRKRLLLTAGEEVVSVSTETGASKVLATSYVEYGVARDENYFYWGRATARGSSIERMPLTQE